VRYSSIRLLAVTGLLASTLAVIPGAHSQSQSAPAQDPAQERPKFRVESNFVRVDAYPLKDGKPVFDLKAEHFEVFEDGVRQKIESFEHVVVRPAGAQSDRIEVSSGRESLQAAANPRNRVFVIFLDTPHVSFGGMHAINEPLIRLMDRILGPDDLVAVMTPEMTASQIVLGRKTQVIEENLRNRWPWARRDLNLPDEREQGYAVCSPPLTGEFIQRKRERATLEALEDLVGYLRTVREERKAILTISEGWLLYGENPSLMNTPGKVPGLDPVTVGPTGTLTTRDPRTTSYDSIGQSECNADRLRLAMMDNKKFFLDLMNEANAGNASFYPVDPRGLAVFDNPIGFFEQPPIAVEMAMVKQRTEALKTLAGNTDGMAVVDTHDLDKGLRRISDDLTSYYLLGYLSTNSRLDGRFRELKVRVTQPGIEVRARRGYKAATEAEVSAARRAADAPVPEAARAVSAAIDRLGRVRPDAQFRIHAVSSAGGTPALWIAGELQAPVGRPDDFARGGTAEIEATVGRTSTATKVTLKPGERTFLATMPLPTGAAGDLSIRARLVPAGGGSLPLSDMLRLESASSGMQPLLFRRGLTTGNRMLPAADLRFSRTERLRLELPVEANIKPGGGRLLNRAGELLQVPVAVGERLDDTSGQRWITADVVLAPLSAGDYAIEMELIGPDRSTRIVSAIRVVR
jgi:VWFA-related protein